MKQYTLNNLPLLPKASVIYEIKNLENHKIYIGSTRNIYRRIYLHRYLLRTNKHSNNHLQRAYNKYGEDKFRIEILEDVSNVQLLCVREQHWINKKRPYENGIGYNICTVAGKVTGRKMSEETKLKFTISNKGREVSIAVREAMSKKLKGVKTKPHSDQTKEKMSLARRGIKSFSKSEHPMAKLTDDDVIRIFEMVKKGEPIKKISNIYNINLCYVYQILNNVTWKELGLVCTERKRYPKLDTDDIKLMLSQGSSVISIAIKYGSSVSGIYKIRKNILKSKVDI